MRDRDRDYGLETVEFGAYPQGEGGGPAPIEWLVLDRKGSRRLLLSKYALDCRPYDDERVDVTWEECTLRAWLNSEFLEAALTDEELARVVEARVENADNPDYDTPGGADTYDRAFLLSLSEVEAYFVARGGDTLEGLVCFPTDRAVANGAYIDYGTGGCRRWLRSPGVGAVRAAIVHPVGGVESFGNLVDNDDVAVRPAMWVSDL